VLKNTLLVSRHAVSRLLVAGVVAALSFSVAAALAAEHEHPQPVVLAPGYADLQFVPPAAGSYALPALGAAANGPVLDTQGNARELHDYMGDKITVLSFIYTRCNDVNGCPLASYVMRRVQERLLQEPDLREQVRLLSFSFDPDYDTPAVLADYASRFVADEFDWQFLTCGSEAQLAGVLRDYNQWIVRDYDAQGRSLGAMSHLLRVYLIDRDKRIRNIYSVSFLHAETIANDIRTLLAAPA